MSRPRYTDVNDETWIGVSDAADLLGVHPHTVGRWCNEGKLVAKRTVGKHRRLALSEVEALARTMSHTPEPAP